MLGWHSIGTPASSCRTATAALVRARPRGARRGVSYPSLQSLVPPLAATILGVAGIACSNGGTGALPLWDASPYAPNDGSRDVSNHTATPISADATMDAKGSADAPISDAGRDDARAFDTASVQACPSDIDVPVAHGPAPSRATAAVDARVRALIAQMTLEEKAAQLDNTTPSIDRIGLPAYQYWNEALHGVVADGATSFPVPLGLGATWNPELVHKIATAISDEARALANTRGMPLTYFSPTINIVRDPRWGRAEESYSEDPYLLSRMAVAFIQGMQGNDPQYLKTVSTAKHYLANNYEKGRTSTSSDVDERTLREYYLPQFRAAVTEAGAFSVMAAYNAVNGVPMVDQRMYLGDLLRGEWHFSGYVVSDCGAVALSYTDHHYAKSYISAAALALNAGTDLECSIGETVYRSYLAEAVEQGVVAEAVIDEALLRVLRGRYLLGEFDPPDSVPYTKIDGSSLDSDEHRDLALRAARASIVLLKNSSNVLPLDDDLSSIAVIGPYAEQVVLGGYSGKPTHTVSVLSAIRRRLPGTEIITASPTSATEAAQAATKADAAVLVLGTDSHFAAEGVDSESLELPNDQEAMAKAVLEANPKTVVVLMAGAPVSFKWIRDHVPAILYGWYGGEEGGSAVADVLFGDVTPAGRLPLTLYSSTAQLPSITNYGIRGDDAEGIGRTYMYFDEAKHGAVLYPFGYGLSYTSFGYDDLQICQTDAKTLVLQVRVTNQTQRAGDEVVQLYVRDTAPGVVRPLRALKAFRRVSLAGGASATVTLRVSLDDIGYWDPAIHRFVVAPGQLKLEVGASSQDIRFTTTIATNGEAFGR